MKNDSDDYLAFVDAAVADEMLNDEDNRSVNVFTLAELVRALVAKNAELVQFIKDDAISRIRVAVGNVEAERDAALAEAERLRDLAPKKVYAENIKIWQQTISQAQDERDDALEVIAKIRALHSPGTPYFEPNGGATLTPCQECDGDMPCNTAALLP